MKLEHLRFGEGPAVVILHGLFGSGDNWRAIARRLEDRYTVILPDLPNHGASPHVSHADYPAIAADVGAFLRSIGVERAVVAGHSMGGKVAMRLALDSPELVRGLISIDMAPRRFEPSHEVIMAAMASLDLGSIGSRGEADQELADAIPDKAVRGFLLKNLVGSESFHWRLNLPLLRSRYADILDWPETSARYDGPALFVAGDRSTYLKEERDLAIIRRLFSSASIETVKEAGHWIHADQPEALLALLNRFLAEVTA